MNTLSRRLSWRAVISLPQPTVTELAADFPLLLLLPDRSLFALMGYLAACRAPHESLAVATRLEVSRRAEYAVRAQSGGRA